MKQAEPEVPSSDPNTLRELAQVFLKLGATSFGGPAAHIALMEDEIVTRRRWLDRQHFLDLVGATNLIPGPNSTELAIHIGQQRGGWPGLWVAGVCFILPAMLIVLVLAWLYDVYGTLPQSQGILRGVQPVVVVIIVQALNRFLPTALKGSFTAVIATLAVLSVIAGVNELLVIAIAAIVGIMQGYLQRRALAITAESDNTPEHATAPDTSLYPTEGPPDEQRPHMAPALFLISASTSAIPLWNLFLVFLKIGSVVYGSGYVLIAFLRSDLVERLHWLTDQQLLDAVAIGQLTPGPVFTTATFIGYQLHGVPGALVATFGIFLPSFLFVGLLSLVMERLRHSVVTRGFLDSVNAASFALMAVVTAELGLRTFVVDGRADAMSIALAVVALALLVHTRLNSAWLIAGGAAAGVMRSLA